MKRASRMRATKLAAAIAASLILAVAVGVGMCGHLCKWWRAPREVALPLDAARCVQCKLNGSTLTTEGADPQMIWDLGNGGKYVGVLEVCVIADESVKMQLFTAPAGKKAIDAKSAMGKELRRGANRVLFPVHQAVSAIRLDYGSQRGLRFDVQSVALRNSPIVIGDWSWRQFFLRAVIAFGVVLFALLHFACPPARLWLFIDRWRYWLALAVLSFAVVFELSGSSIGRWNVYVPNPHAIEPLFGEPRAVRSDEFATFTPLALAQSYRGYPYFNDIPRGVPTDMFTIHPQPVLHPLVVFRPFLAGHIFLGFARGLAFFWFSRWLALLLVMYEMFKVLTGGGKALSGIGACMVTLSPAIQWWSAANALAEMFIFGGLFVVCLARFLDGRTLRNRWLPTVGMMYSAVGYIMTLYPAAQIPLAYVFAAVVAGVAIERRERLRMDVRTLTFVFFAACVAVGCLAWYARMSADAFHAIANTAYPGDRILRGGCLPHGLWLSWGNLFFPFDVYVEKWNVFELAQFIDFFPLGLFLAAVLFLREKHFDLIICLLVLLVLFLSGFAIIGFPEWLARISLVGRSMSQRAMVAVGFAQLIILVRAVSLVNARFSWWRATSIAFRLSLAVALLSWLAYGKYIDIGRGVLIGVVSFVGFVLWLRFRSQYVALGVYIMGLMFAAGVGVNPIQECDAGVCDSDLAVQIKKIAAKSHGLWMVDEALYPMNEYPMMMGAPTINVVNLYPLRERWLLLDPKMKYEHVWNRHAHIRMTVKKNGDAHFKLMPLNQNYFSVDISNRDVGRLGVRYVLSKRNLAALSDASVKYRLICRASEWSIFEVEKNPA